MAHLDGALTGLTKGPMQKGNRSLIADARKNPYRLPRPARDMRKSLPVPYRSG
jgi:hypothetical protein